MKNQNEVGFVSALAGLIALFSLVTMHYVIVMYFWNWFIVPLGLLKISFLHAVGISMLVGILTVDHERIKEISEKHRNTPLIEIISSMISRLVGSLLLLSIGYLVHLYI